MHAAVQAAEQVARQVAVGVKHLQLLLDFGWGDSELGEVSVEGCHGVRQLLHVVPADSSEEGCGIRAVVEPVLLLPADKARSALRDRLEDRLRHVVRDSPTGVGELGGAVGTGKVTCGGPIGDAWQAEDSGLLAIDGSLVPIASGLLAQVAGIVGPDR